MSLQQDGSAKTLYLSQSSHPTKIYMNVYENHLSFIKDVKMFPKQLICNCCGKLSARMLDSKQHQIKCDGSVRYVYPGGVYKNASSVFDDMKSVGFDVNPEERCEQWFACFDFEVCHCNFRECVDEVDNIEEGMVWGKIQVPVSFSVRSNLEDVETVHVSSKDPGDLLSKFVDGNGRQKV